MDLLLTFLNPFMGILVGIILLISVIKIIDPIFIYIWIPKWDKAIERMQHEKR